MSFIVTPPSASAPIAASAARSTVSLSGCLPNLVMWIPRIQMSSLAICSAPSSVERVRSRSRSPRCRRCRCRSGRSRAAPSCRACTCSGSGSTLTSWRARSCRRSRRPRPRTAPGCPARRSDDDRERAHLALGRDVDRAELGAEAGGARVAPVEEPGAAARALVGDEVRLVARAPGSRPTGSASPCGPPKRVFRDPCYQPGGLRLHRGERQLDRSGSDRACLPSARGGARRGSPRPLPPRAAERR